MKIKTIFFSILLLFLCVGASSNPFSCYSTIFSEDFESYSSFSDGTGGWPVVDSYLPAGTTSIDTEVAAANTNQSLRLDAAKGHAVDIRRQFDITSVSSLKVEAYVRVGSINSGFCLELNDREEGYAIDFYGDTNTSTFWIGYYNDVIDKDDWAEEDTGISVNNDTWYKMEIIIDLDFQTWELWIDGSITNNGTYYPETVPNEIELRLNHSAETPQKVYFDEIVLKVLR